MQIKKFDCELADKHALARLVEELKTKRGEYKVGIFYDPLAGKGDVADEEPLRKQVRDFVAWLKNEKHLN